MNTVLLSLLKQYWKYIAIFILGMVIACIIPITPAGRLVRKLNQFKNQKEEVIKKLEHENTYLKGINDHLKKEKNITEQSIKRLHLELDSLKKDRKIYDDILNNIDNNGYKELDKINNFNDKELYDFYKNLNK